MNINFVKGQLLVGFGALRRSGVIQSLLRGRPVDGMGSPLPWLTYGAIHELEKRLLPTDEVLEFGSGHSSLWFAKRVASIVAIETSQDWINQVSSQAQLSDVRNLQLKYHSKFDPQAFLPLINNASVILIDGAWRHEVAKLVAGQHLLNQLLVIDNTDAQGPFEDLPKYFKSQNRIVVDFKGMGPGLLHSWQTTLVLPATT